MYNQLVQYFQYPFVRYALIVGVMTAFCASLLGVTLVLRRFSFLGDALSHVAFGAMAAAAAMSLTNSMVVIFPVTALRCRMENEVPQAFFILVDMMAKHFH